MQEGISRPCCHTVGCDTMQWPDFGGGREANKTWQHAQRNYLRGDGGKEEREKDK